MELFTIGALVLSGLSGLSRLIRGDAENLRKEAIHGVARAAKKAQTQITVTNDAANNLARQRAAAYSLLCPRLHDAFERLNLSMGEGGAPTRLRTREQIEALRQKVMANFVRLELEGDAAVLAMSVTAVVLKGIDYMDQAGMISVPVLHQSVEQAIASLPFDGADALAHLVPCGALSVADAVADVFIVFSAVKLIRNIYKTNALTEDTGKLNQQAKELKAKRKELRKYQQSIETAEADQAEACYQLYRATVLAEAHAACPPETQARTKGSVIAGLKKAAAAWWQAISVEPKIA